MLQTLYRPVADKKLAGLLVSGWVGRLRVNGEGKSYQCFLIVFGDSLLSLPSGSGQVIGRATIAEGQTSLVVDNPQATPQSTIFLTLEDSAAPQGLTWSVVSRKDGRFSIQLSQGAPHDLTFAYWILDTYTVDEEENARDREERLSTEQDASLEGGATPVSANEPEASAQEEISAPVADETDTTPASSTEGSL